MRSEDRSFRLDRRAVRACAASFVLLLAAMISGCWDQREIEERISVVAVGIDLADENPKRITATVQIPIPIKIAGSSGGAGGSGDPVKVMSATGRTLVEAFTDLQRRLNQQLFFGHTRVIAIGEELARAGLYDELDAFRRNPEIRRLLWPLVVKGKASDLLESKPELEQIPTVFIMSMIETGGDTGRIPDINLGKFYIDFSSSAEDPYLNYVEAGEKGVKWLGIAVFRGDKMVGSLDELDTWSFMRVGRKTNGGPIIFEYGGGDNELISFTTDTTHVKSRYRLEGGRVAAEFTVYVEGDLIAKTFDTDFSDLREIEKLERKAEEYLEKEAAAMLRKLQKEFDSDILGIGTRLRAYHPRVWSQVKDANYFPEADIRVKYVVKLRRIGMEMK